MKIVELDGYAVNPGDLSLEALKAYGELVVYERTAEQDVVSRAQDAEMLLINKINLTAAVLAQLPRLRYIGVMATGYNTVDIEAAKAQGIVVTNIPAYSTDSVAQMTFAHILNLTNQVAHYAQRNREGRWSKNADFCYWDTPLIELHGKTLGIVGLGNIGCKVAQIAHQFGMDVFALTSRNAADLPEGIQKTTWEGLLAASDILTLHAPLTAGTQMMVNGDTLKRMKPGALLINTSRGGLIDEQAVAEALATGQLGGYGADVMTIEPPASDNPLLHAPNAYITPHIAWATKAARQRLLDICIENVKAFLAGTPQNVVNL